MGRRNNRRKIARKRRRIVVLPYDFPEGYKHYMNLHDHYDWEYVHEKALRVSNEFADSLIEDDDPVIVVEEWDERRINLAFKAGLRLLLSSRERAILNGTKKQQSEYKELLRKKDRAYKVAKSNIADAIKTARAEDRNVEEAMQALDRDMDLMLAEKQHSETLPDKELDTVSRHVNRVVDNLESNGFFDKLMQDADLPYINS